jgi:predicted Zn-dependent protease
MSRDVRKLDLARMGETAVQKCRDASNPTDIPPGDYEVILEPSAVAELMEWMTYTCFGARSIEEKTSALAGHLGEPLVGEAVTIYDDASEAEGIPTPFDFEGLGKKRLDIIEKGVARGYGTDSIWASRLNIENSAHGMIRSGEEADPIPMNLFLEAGDVAAADMVGQVERGLLVTRFHYVNGFLDTRRALMTGMTRDGTFLIENGKIKGGVGNLRFTESMIEAFRNVKRISRERQVIPSWWSEVSNTGAFTMPTLHLGRFHFTGKTEGA